MTEKLTEDDDSSRHTILILANKVVVSHIEEPSYESDVCSDETRQKAKYYFINHATKEYQPIELSKVLDIIDDISASSYHTDCPCLTFTEVIEAQDLPKVEKMWEMNDTEEILNMIKRFTKPRWCCASDGWFSNICCEWYAYRLKIEEYIHAVAEHRYYSDCKPNKSKIHYDLEVLKFHIKKMMPCTCFKSKWYDK